MASFEERLERLERISKDMRQPGIPLKESVDLFEEGMALSRELEDELRAIEQKVQILVLSDNDEAPVFKTFSQEEHNNE